jgi:hypothetical protein
MFSRSGAGECEWPHIDYMNKANQAPPPPPEAGPWSPLARRLGPVHPLPPRPWRLGPGPPVISLATSSPSLIPVIQASSPTRQVILAQVVIVIVVAFLM